MTRSKESIATRGINTTTNPEAMRDIIRRRLNGESLVSIGKAGASPGSALISSASGGSSAPPQFTREKALGWLEIVARRNDARSSRSIGHDRDTIARWIERFGLEEEFAQAKQQPTAQGERIAHKYDGQVWNSWTIVDGSPLQQAPCGSAQSTVQARCACGP